MKEKMAKIKVYKGFWNLLMLDICYAYISGTCFIFVESCRSRWLLLFMRAPDNSKLDIFNNLLVQYPLYHPIGNYIDRDYINV